MALPEKCGDVRLRVDKLCSAVLGVVDLHLHRGSCEVLRDSTRHVRFGWLGFRSPVLCVRLMPKWG
eukprot:3571041-Alexandrium_andersonii.AAC.1